MSDTPRQKTPSMTDAIPIPMVPTHWIDTTPVASTDKPCTIGSLDLSVQVSGLYADVTETITIDNPNARDISADLALPMPDGAVVHGYALEIDGQMIDGVVVPKEKARVAFETEQRIGADPGLVEAVKGNVYRTRVYPVPAKGSRRVTLRYLAPLQVVGGRGAFLDAPMPAEPLAKRDIRVDVELLDCPAPQISGVNGKQFEERGCFWSVEAHESDVAPREGIRVALPVLPEAFALVERDSEGTLWFTASEAVPQEATGAAGSDDLPAIDALTILWDCSGSRAGIDHGRELALLRSWGACESIASFCLVAFSDQAEPVRTFATADELTDAIESLRYDGGSDFQALSQALAELPAGTNDACVLFSDGMDTLSDEPISWPEARKVLAVVSGAERDTESLRQACGGLVFDLLAAPQDATALARALFASRLLSAVRGEGVADIMGIGSGADGRYTVVGRLTSPATRIAFAETGTELVLDDSAAREGSTIARAWAALRVAQLSPRADDHADELLELGRRFGVVSPATSLLVLETLAQWLRYDIEPPTTWERMHAEWTRHRAGIMQVSSDEELADRHLDDLRREWKKLLQWWETEYPVRRRESDGTLYCTHCGEPVDPGARFCANCGTRLSRRRARSLTRPLTERHPRAMEGEFFDENFATARASMALEDMAPMPMAGAALTGAAMFDACEAVVDGAARMMDERSSDEPSTSSGSGATVQVQPWMPDAVYLKALDEALATGTEAAREAYFQQRADHMTSPSFFIDCAGWFLAHDDRAFGLRVLTNLAELRIEDAALLRVMSWRLREAGELGRALVILRRVLKLRPEDSQSHRDLALVLDELTRQAFAEGDEDAARAHAEEAADTYRTIATTPWQRRDISIGLFAVEEYNVLRAWAERQSWTRVPELPAIDDELEGVLDCDLRITLAWDADETDVDLHVTEPSGEEAYYGHRLTYQGGRVSEDITDGYGPELYEIRHTKSGTYLIRAHYYASHQQTVIGPASCTLTVYTDWGRPTQRQQITSTRLDDENEMIEVGTASYQ